MLLLYHPTCLLPRYFTKALYTAPFSFFLFPEISVSLLTYNKNIHALLSQEKQKN